MIDLGAFITTVAGGVIGMVVGAYITSYLLRRGLMGDIKKYAQDIIKVASEKSELMSTLKDINEFAKKGKEFIESKEFKALLVEADRLMKSLAKDYNSEVKLDNLPKPKPRSRVILQKQQDNKTTALEP